MAAATPRLDLSDEKIVARVQAGEAHLFALIFERHYARLERFVRALGVPEADLEDVLADTFVRALAKVRDWDAGRGVRYLSYLYAIARNLVMDRARERGRVADQEWLDEVRDEIPAVGETPLEAVLRRDQAERIRRALDQLNLSDRTIILLSYERQLNCREIMVAMEKPSVTAVTTHLYKAMRKLRLAVLREGEELGEVPCAARS